MKTKDEIIQDQNDLIKQLTEELVRFDEAVNNFMDNNVSNEQIEAWLDPSDDSEVPLSWLDFAAVLILARLRRHKDAKNFNVAVITDKDGTRWIFTAQRADGVTPAERIRSLEEKLKEAEANIAQISST